MNGGIGVGVMVAGAAAAVVVLVATLAGRPGGGRRYRPGRRFEFTPLWMGVASDSEVMPESDEVPRPPGDVLETVDDRRECGDGTGGASGQW